MLLKDKCIFILGATRFDEPFSSTSFSVAKYLAADNLVYYIDYPYTWNDCIRYRETPAFKLRLPYLLSKNKFLKDSDIKGLKILFSPPLASINFLPEGPLYRYLLDKNQQKIVQRIKRLVKRNGIEDFVYINSFNFHYPDIATYLKPLLHVYHCVDPVIMPYDIRHGIISEGKLIENSDLVICTSKYLYEQKKQVNPNTFFIPNAADIEKSSQALNDELPVHKNIARLRRPLIGYVGTIERRIDYTMLKEVLALNPDKHFVFVGPITKEYVPDWFFNQPNFTHVGAVSNEEVPAVMKGFDVALIPFKKDDVSKTIFPLKLFEYLGAGKPVVATDFNPDLEEYTGNAVIYCKTAEEFSVAIDKSLKQGDAEFIERLTIAQQNTWTHRVTEFSELLERFIHEKTNS